MREKSNFKNKTNHANFKIEEPTKGMPLKTFQFMAYLWILGLILSILLIFIEIFENKISKHDFKKRFLRKTRAYSDPDHWRYRAYLESMTSIFRLNTG